MKLRSKILTGVIGSAMLLTMGASLSPAADCASAVVSQIGVRPSLESASASKYIAMFDCLDASEAWAGNQQFVLSTDVGDSGYATLLTAVSLGQTVYIRVPSTNWRSLVEFVYLNDTPAP